MVHIVFIKNNLYKTDDSNSSASKIKLFGQEVIRKAVNLDFGKARHPQTPYNDITNQYHLYQLKPIPVSAVNWLIIYRSAQIDYLYVMYIWAA